jgi:protein SCO1/2
MRAWLVPIIVWASLACGCHRPTTPADVMKPLEVARYPARGTIRKINLGTSSAVIAHEAIPGYMEAMAMEFNVAGEHELEGLQPGDVVTFRLSVEPARSWIDQLHKVGTAPIAAGLPEPESALATHTPAPDCALVDSGGRHFQVTDYRGQVLVISFIFTRCPLPDFCPRMSSRLAELPGALSDAGARWHLLSISFDPEYDTPERLAAYGAGFGADPARWTFAMGEERAVLEFGAAFGLAVQRTGAGFEHNLRTVVIDPRGRVAHIFSGNTWTTAELAAEVRRAMTGPND